jgi:hypothetical protein
VASDLVAFPLKRIAYFPSEHAGITEQRLPSGVRNELRRQVERETVRYRKSDALRAQKMPSKNELEELLATGWNADTHDDAGYSSWFSSIKSTFGEIHDMDCKRKDKVFTCMLGVTFLQDGKPKYGRAQLEFERDPATDFKLTEHIREIIVT